MYIQVDLEYITHSLVLRDDGKRDRFIRTLRRKTQLSADDDYVQVMMMPGP